MCMFFGTLYVQTYLVWSVTPCLPVASLSTADFGFARHLQNNMMAATLCGSPMYMASILSPSSSSALSHTRHDSEMLLSPGSGGHHVPKLWCQGWSVEYRNHCVSVPDWESPFSRECSLFALWHSIMWPMGLRLQRSEVNVGQLWHELKLLHYNWPQNAVCIDGHPFDYIAKGRDFRTILVGR